VGHSNKECHPGNVSQIQEEGGCRETQRKPSIGLLQCGSNPAMWEESAFREGARGGKRTEKVLVEAESREHQERNISLKMK
jgi:hypothetical protein